MFKSNAHLLDLIELIHVDEQVRFVEGEYVSIYFRDHSSRIAYVLMRIYTDIDYYNFLEENYEWILYVTKRNRTIE